MVFHFQGYSKIENLDEYSGLRCLWLENNIIEKIENLEKLKEVRCLYLHNNFIAKIENLEELVHLHTINLCHNRIHKVENLGNLIICLITFMLRGNSVTECRQSAKRRTVSVKTRQG